jgi:hypothetical protein
MASLMDFWHGIISIFTSADMITLGIMIVIVLAAGFIMQGFEALATTTLVALVLFGLAGYVRAVALNGANAAELAEKQWHGFLTMPVQTVIFYAIAFAVGIGIIHTVRTLVIR